MHPSEEASALFFPCHSAVQGFSQRETWLERFTYTHTHTTPPRCTHSFPKSVTHIAPGHLQLCNSTQQQYSLNCLAVYFLKEVKSPT